ncbi:MAG: hypothetical protein R3B99_02205 [Polyangiales bacterium]
MKRATSLLTQTSIEVMLQAAVDALPARRLRDGVRQRDGEIQIAVELNADDAGEGSGIVSPARFDVHNTAAGLFSISTPSTEASPPPSPRARTPSR